MKTIDTATLFTDVAAVATTQPGKAAPPTGQGGENGGAFAKVLQVTSNSSAAATVATKRLPPRRPGLQGPSLPARKDEVRVI